MSGDVVIDTLYRHPRSSRAARTIRSACLGVWVLEGIYQLSRRTAELCSLRYPDHGYSLLSTKRKDSGDGMWNLVCSTLFDNYLLLYLVVFATVSTLLPRRDDVWVRSLVQVGMSTMFLGWLLGSIQSVLFVSFAALSLVLCSHLRLPQAFVVTYAASLVFFTFLGGLESLLYNPISLRQSIDVRRQLLYTQSVSVLLATRGAVVRLESDTSQGPTSVLDALRYMLYFPLAHFGPLVPWDVFSREANGSRKRGESASAAFSALIESTVSFLTAEWLQSHVHMFELVSNKIPMLHSREVVVLIFVIEITYCLKWKFVYSLASIATSGDSAGMIRSPTMPCLTLSYTLLWRMFDVSHYQAMLRYVYKPILGQVRGHWGRLLASLAVHAFLGLWHGACADVLLWVSVSFLSLSAERWLVEVWRRSGLYKRSSATVRREVAALFGAIIGSMLLLNTALFLFGSDLALACLQKIFQGGILWGLAMLVVPFYFWMQLSIDVIPLWL